jgi:hypothetical protein
MHEHPTDWWEVATVDNAVFRVDDATAATLRTWMHGTRSGAIDFTDIYGCESTIILDKLTALWRCTHAAREASRLRAALHDTEQKAFDDEHARPEWDER